MAEDNKQAAKNAAKAAADSKKAKKRKWFPIIAPEAFQSKVIGEVLLEDASVLMNRCVKVNMMQLMGDMKKQSVNVMFKVNDVKDGKAYTQAVKFEISAFSMKRLAKREKDKLSDSFVVKTADGKLVRLKCVMITNAMTNGAVLASLNKIKLEQLIIDMVTYKFQKEVREMLHKVYPLRNFDIRVLELETKKKKETVEEEMLMKLKKEQDKKLQEKAEAAEQEAKGQKSEDKTEDEESEDAETDEPASNVPEDTETSDNETDDEDSESEEEPQ